MSLRESHVLLYFCLNRRLVLKVVPYGPMTSLESAAEESVTVPASIASSSRLQSGKKDRGKPHWKNF